MVSLKQDGTGQGIICVDASACASFQGFIINYTGPVQDHRDMSVNKNYPDMIPFSSCFALVPCGPDPVENCTRPLDPLHTAITVNYLDFVSSPQVFSTIAPDRDIIIQGQFKIMKFLYCPEVAVAPVGTEIRFGRLVL